MVGGPIAAAIAGGVAGEGDVVGLYVAQARRGEVVEPGPDGKRVETRVRYCAAAASGWPHGRFAHDDDDEDGDGEEDTIEDLQAGHGSHVAGMIYARGIREKDGEVMHKKALFRQASEIWHEFLGLGGVQQGQEEGQTKEQEMIRARKRPRPSEDDQESGSYRRWKHARGVDLREKLQEMMGVRSEFRGVQEEMIRVILDATLRVLVVMSTGGGKSLLFMMPVWVQRHGMSVVVVLLIGLR
ncbi:hypothetical protein ACMFMG_004280 [Clarireedia jacksonii]